MPEKIEIHQLVSFRIDNEEFGLDILAVQEINRMMEITHVPNCPEFVEGIINLRGRIIPVVNLRKKFNLAEREIDKKTRIVVVNLKGKVAGLLVDEVHQVLGVPANQIEPPPAMVSAIHAEYIKAVGKVNDKLLILLDLEKLLPQSDQEKLEKIAA